MRYIKAYILIIPLLFIKIKTQDMEIYKLVFPQYPEYLDKLDSIRKNADLIYIDRNYEQDDFEVFNLFKPYSNAVFIKNSIFETGINIKGQPIEKTEFFLNDVRMNSDYYGGFNLSHIPSVFAETVIIDKNTNNPIAGFSSLSSSIYAESAVKDNRGLDIRLHGGNIYGSGSIKYTGNYKYFYWNTTAAYQNSSGYDFSSDFPERNYSARTELMNFENQRIALFAKAGINDVNSDISFSYMHLNNDRGIPFNQISEATKFYLNEDQYKMDIFNFRFMTELNDFIDAKGNFYYKKYRQTINRFDNEEFNSQNEDFAFTRINDDYTFGANLKA